MMGPGMANMDQMQDKLEQTRKVIAEVNKQFADPVNVISNLRY